MPTPFASVPLPPERSLTKPRRTGLTMMVDFGLPLPALESTLEMAAPYIDLGKVAVGTARLYDEAYLRRKLDLYKRYDVRPFIGGMFVEFVVCTQGMEAVPAFYAEAVRLGFEVIEVSDNTVPLDDAQRHQLIVQAREAGLAVFGEVGAKTPGSAPELLAHQAQISLEAGAELVLVEAAELAVDGKPNQDMVAAVTGNIPLDRTLFELGGPWIANTSLHEVYRFKKFLVETFGPDVNIANVKPEDVLDTEALRCGLGTLGPLPSQRGS